jgi:hypothetical protein
MIEFTQLVKFGLFGAATSLAFNGRFEVRFEVKQYLSQHVVPRMEAW